MGRMLGVHRSPGPSREAGRRPSLPGTLPEMAPHPLPGPAPAGRLTGSPSLVLKAPARPRRGQLLGLGWLRTHGDPRELWAGRGQLAFMASGARDGKWGLAKLPSSPAGPAHRPRGRGRGLASYFSAGFQCAPLTRAHPALGGAEGSSALRAGVGLSSVKEARLSPAGWDRRPRARGRLGRSPPSEVPASVLPGHLGPRAGDTAAYAETRPPHTRLWAEASRQSDSAGLPRAGAVRGAWKRRLADARVTAAPDVRPLSLPLYV